MELFNKQSLSGEVEIPKNSGINPLEKDSLAKGVSGKGTPGIYNPLRSSGYHSASNPNYGLNKEIKVQLRRGKQGKLEYFSNN